MRRRAKLDANHGQIVRALELAGCSVQSLAALGGGVPDLLVLCRGKLSLVEVKDGDKPPSARRLTPLEAEFASRWPVLVVESVNEAIAKVVGR